MSGAPAGGAPMTEDHGGFRRSRAGRPRASTGAQAVILRNLVSQVAELIGQLRT